MVADEKLISFAKQLRDGEEAPRISVRTLLDWFGAQRRGYWVVENIRKSLENSGLTTEPDFESAYIDSLIKFSLVTQGHGSTDVSPPAASERDVTSGDVLEAIITFPSDPTYRISKLAAANTKPISVAPSASLEAAVTLMLTNDFSQLPVMTSEREVKGVISWASVGVRLASGKSGSTAGELMDPHQEIRASDSLFQAIPAIVQNYYVLVRGSDNRITGIITASDLSEQFQQLAEPFLSLGEIENHMRRLLHGKFSLEDLKSIADPDDTQRLVASVADLTFGEYVRLLEKDERWLKLGLKFDRKTFCTALDEVRKIRNDVMHFDPDGVPNSDLDKLRKFTRFLSRLQAIGIT